VATSDASAWSLVTLLTQLDAVLTGPGLLKRAPSLFSASAVPKGCADTHYALDLSSRDTGEYRNGQDDVMRAEHTLVVSVLKSVKPLDQWHSMLEAVALEELVMGAMLDRSNLPAVVVSWAGTTRTPAASREWLVLELTFILRTDWSWAE